MVLQLFLGRTTEQVFQQGLENIRLNKAKAIKSRDQPDRAFHASAAVCFAIATRSLAVYQEVILWQKRFLRDPLTVISIFDGRTVCTQESIALLSGVPEDLEDISGLDIRTRIEKSKRIVMHLLEYALSALKEQFFACSDWIPSLGLFTNVTIARMEASAKLKDLMRLSTADVYEIVWRPTLS